MFKNEHLLSRSSDLEDARKIVTVSVASFNERRPHLALKYQTPDETHRAF
ncbi:integrase core domain-containing protein [Salinimonas marina]|nr:integrase core domain-containing protein [Salinimonas marina]